MNQQSTEGIVLRRTNYQEADRILTILTKDSGKLSAIAKGARRSKSKLAGGIELFAVNQLTLIKGKSSLQTVSSSRVKTQFGNIVKDIERTMKAYDYLKLVDKAVDEHAEEHGLFEILAGGLSGLDNTTLDPSITDVWFYLHVLATSGLQPNLRQDTEGKTLEEDKIYNFNSMDMQFTEDKNGTYNSNHIKLLRIAITSSSIKNLSNVNVNSAITKHCYNCVRNMIEHNLL